MQVPVAVPAPLPLAVQEQTQRPPNIDAGQFVPNFFSPQMLDGGMLYQDSYNECSWSDADSKEALTLIHTFANSPASLMVLAYLPNGVHSLVIATDTKTLSTLNYEMKTMRPPLLSREHQHELERLSARGYLLLLETGSTTMSLTRTVSSPSKYGTQLLLIIF